VWIYPDTPVWERDHRSAASFNGSVTGDSPQPGETPRNEGEPWSYTDPGAPWWRVQPDRESEEALAEAAARPRHPRRRPAPTTPANALPPVQAEPAFAPEALDAHAAGVQDAATVFEPPPAVLVEAEQEPAIEHTETTAAAEAVTDQRRNAEQPTVAIERDHDGRTKERYNLKSDAGYAVSADQSKKKPVPPEPVPDVMLLPEPQRETPVPGQGRLSKAKSQHTPGKLDPVKAARMENSPFWLSDEERAAAGNAWPAPEVRDRLAGQPGPADGRRGQPPLQKPRKPHRPTAGLIGLVALGLVAAFFSWVSAEPFWLAVGHGDAGAATVTQCTGAGVTQRCFGSFSSADGAYDRTKVTLLGVGPEARNAGAVAPARMVSPDSRQAFVGSTGLLVHLRWTLGFILVVLCGYGIAGLTGARQLETGKARRAAVLISLAGPVVLLVGFLFAAY
jgi:hypothetical protein